MRQAVTVLAVAGAAGAAFGQVELDVGSFDLPGGAVETFEFDVGAGGQITSFAFEGFYTDDGAGGTWASDLIMTLTAPNGDQVAIGGFTEPTDLVWDFDGSGSDASGFYASGPHAGFIDSPAMGTWTVEMSNIEAFGPHSWDDVVVTLIPAPGAAALLGLGGLVALRRRR